MDAGSSIFCAVTTVDDADSRTFDAVLVLYIACSKLPDDNLDEAQAARILALTEAHTSGLAHGYAERALSDVSKALVAAGSVDAQLEMVVEAAELLGKVLDDDAKRSLVDELQSIAAADGAYTGAEQDFVKAAAKTLGVDS